MSRSLPRGIATKGTAMKPRLSFSLVEGRYALAQLPPGSPRPDWARGRFTAIIESAEGTSVVCAETEVPANVKKRGGFRCIEIGGSFDLESVGIVAAAVQPLAAAGISVFAYSTWETDYLLIQEYDFPKASMALKEAGLSFLSSLFP
jgi:hypothetical protein